MAVIINVVGAYDGRQLARAQADLAKMGAAAQASGGKVAKAFETAGRRVTTAGQRVSSVGTTLTRSVSLPLALVGGYAVKTQAQFEQSMNTLAEAASLPQRDVAKLGALAKKMGADTVFSANEAADAMVELAKAGIKPAQIEAGALKATMAVAATEGLALADSATIVSNAMSTFKLRGSQATEVADALAGGSKASTATVRSLAQAMSQVGVGAKDAGLTLQGTVAVLAAFDNAGIKGSDAGTSLKTMLARLVPQTDRAKAAMSKLGLSFTDARGEFVPVEQIAGRLQRAFTGLSAKQRTVAMNTIFGSDATRAATVLMRQGEGGIRAMIKATTEQGAAQRLADARMKGTAGAIEALKGSIETAALSVGEALAPTIRAVAGGLAKVANAFSSLDAGTQQWVATTGMVLVAIGPVVKGMGMLTTGVGHTISSVGSLGEGLWKVGKPLRAFTSGLVQPQSGLSGFASRSQRAGSAVARGMQTMASGVGSGMAKMGKFLMANPWILVVAAVAAAVYLIIKHWDTVKRWLLQTWAAIERVVGPVWERIAAPVVRFAKVVAAAVGRLMPVVRAKLQPLMAWISTNVVPTVQAAGEFIGAAWNAVTKVLALVMAAWRGELQVAVKVFRFVGDVVGKIVRALGAVISWLAPVVAKVFGFIAGYVRAWVKVVSAVLHVLMPVVTGVFRAIGVVIGTYLRVALAVVKTVFSSMWAVAKGVFYAIKAVIEGVLRVIRGIFQVFTGLLRGDWSKAWEGVKNIVGGVMHAITGILGGAWRAIRGVLVAVWNGLKSAAAALWNGMRALIANTLGTIRAVISRAWSAITGAVGGAWDRIKLFVATGIARVLTTIRELPGKAVAFVSSAWSAIIGTIAGAWDKIKTAVGDGIGRVVTTVKELPGKAREALSDIGSALLDAGKKLIQGFVDGITGMFGKVRDVLGDLTGKLTSWKGPPARDRTILTKSGRMIIEGLVRGLVGGQEQVRRTLERLTVTIAHEFDRARRNVDGPLAALVKAQRTHLLALARDREGIGARLERAKQRLVDAVATRRDYATGVRESLLGYAGVVGDDEGPVTGRGIADRLKARLAALRKFAADIAALTRRHVSKDLIAQIAGEGVERAGATAAALASASAAEIAEINKTQAQIAHSAAATGNKIAGTMYDAGVKAAQGIVNGLKAEQRAIERQMLLIAKGMQTAIKKALGINSPSRVLDREVGRPSGLGVLNGLKYHAKAIRAAMAGLIEVPAPETLTARVSAASGPYRPSAGVRQFVIPVGAVQVIVQVGENASIEEIRQIVHDAVAEALEAFAIELQAA